MKKASIVVWNNLNIILCCICGFMAMYMHDWHCMVGWLCAALAFMQSNLQRFWMDRWELESKKAINDLYRVSEGTNIIARSKDGSYEREKENREKDVLDPPPRTQEEVVRHDSVPRKA